MKYSASSVWENKDEYDVVVVGAGHAGCEAALATARLGFKTVIFTVSVDSIALMPCNPNIGGSSKGHLVRELDALGGEMGKVIDQTFIQSKMLNSSKGPAVYSLRAQADKANYSKTMRQVLQNQENLDIRQMEVTEILAEDGKITGVQTYSGAIYRCKAVVLCTGTYLKARCIYGEISTHTGPNGLQSANYLTDSLKALGIKMYRFKTGTPARIDKNTIDFSINSRYYKISNLKVKSYASYQVQNAALAVLAVKVLLPEVSQDVIREGIVKMYWPGRMEEIAENVYVDGAHNPGAVRQIYNSLADSDKEWLLLFAVCSDKDYTEMIRILGKIPWKRIYITKIDSARGADTAAVRQCFEEAAGCPICEFESAGEAFKAALRDRGDEKEENLLCLGSLYLVGEIKELAATMF